MLISFTSVFSDLWKFVKKPRLDHLQSSFKENPLEVIYNLLLIDFLLMLPLTALLGWVGIDKMDHKIEDLMDKPLALAGMAVLIAPLMEEAVFRLPMRYAYLHTAISLGLVLILSSTIIESELFIFALAAIILSSVSLFQFINQQRNNLLNERIDRWWEAHFYLPFWLLSTAFALLHLSNFGNAPLYLAPILVLPQFVLGVVIGYVRTGYGFIYGVLFHALHNGILIGLAMLGGEMSS